MKSVYLAAGASLLHAARAIPALITTVFNCPDVQTVTVTAYPPGYTNTGPVYGGMTAGVAQAQAGQPQAQSCSSLGALTTSYQTNYATTTVAFSSMGMYPGPPGCPSEIMAFMPTTVTCSQPITTGWVAYVSDIACTTCTLTTVAAFIPSYNTSGTATITNVMIWTEAVSVSGSSITTASMIGQPSYASAIPSSLYPYYPTGCSAAATPGGSPYPAGAQASGAPVAPGSIDFNQFTAGASAEIISAGYTSPANAAPQGAPQTPPAQGASTYPTPAGAAQPSYTSGVYPSINFDDFTAGATAAIISATPTGAPAPAGVTPAAGSQGPQPYPSMDFSNTNAWAVTVSYSVPSQGNTAARAGGSSSYTGTYSAPAAAGTQVTANTAATGSSIDFAAIFTAGADVSVIPSATGPGVVETPTASAFTVPTNFASAVLSINVSTGSFSLATDGTDTASLGIVSATTAVFESPTATGNPSATYPSVNYPSLDFSNPTLFQPIDISTPGVTAAPATTSA